jgi:threonine/homoserine/homoserine lactone efflux protein
VISQLIPFITASIILTISPGPDIIYVLVQSIANGRKAGIMTTLGLVSGILIHTSLVAFGVSAIIKESESFFLAIRIFGALYLFFLAFKVFSAEGKISLK